MNKNVSSIGMNYWTDKWDLHEDVCPCDVHVNEWIKDQGLNTANSQVMEIASWLTDVYGPRLSGSPNIRKAGQWAVAEMKKWGLVNVALEPWANSRNFTRGWSNDKFYLVIEANDPKFDKAATAAFLKGLNPTFVKEVPA